MNIGIGCDHAGFEYKEALKNYLVYKGFQVKDYGTHNTASVDYPDYVHPLAIDIENGVNDFGILICGSANGVCITANKHKGIRAALCWQNDIASLARQHNNANVLCLPARFIAFEYAKTITDTFLNTAFEGGRHQVRVDKISKGC